MNCARCHGLLSYDAEAQASVCINGHYDYPLIPGATLPRNRPPTGHQGIYFNRSKPIATRGPQKRRNHV